MTTPMGASDCKAETPTDKANLTWQQINGQSGYTNTGSSSGAKVHCPIIKQTSASGRTDDRLNLVSVTFASSGDGLSSCQVNVWRMSSSSSWGNNQPALVDGGQPQPVGAGTTNVFVGNSNSFKNYWGSSTTWAFAELVCNLTLGSTISTYSVTERGTAHGALIIPFSYAAPWTGNTSNYEFSGGHAGRLENFDNGGGFIMGAMVFPNGMTNLQLMVGPSIANNNFTQFKCTFEGTTKTALQNPGPTDFPARVLSFTRSTPFAQEVFTCGLFEGSTLTAAGDAKFYSYKMF